MDFTSWHGKLVTGDRRICRKRCDPLCLSSASPKGCDEHTLYNTRARARAHAREHTRAHESHSFYIIYEEACPEASLKTHFQSNSRAQRVRLLEHSWRTSGTFMNVQDVTCGMLGNPTVCQQKIDAFLHLINTDEDACRHAIVPNFFCFYFVVSAI